MNIAPEALLKASSAALQGMIANPTFSLTPEEAAEKAAEYGDALCRHLINKIISERNEDAKQ